MTIVDHRQRIAALMAQHQLGAITSLREITQGVENSCYSINETYILRLHRHNPRYQTEAAVYRSLADSTLPVPHVIAVDCASTDYHAILTTQLRGKAVHPSARALSTATQTQLGIEIGRALATLHHTTLDSLGAFIAADDERSSNWWAIYRQIVTDSVQRLRPHAHLIPDVLEQMTHLTERHASLLQQVQQLTLVHGDFQLSNVLQHAGHLSGIIDMEWARIADPAYDFATDYHWHKYTPQCAQAIYDGYQSVRPLTDDDHRRIALYRLLPMLEDALYAHQIGWLDGAGWHQSIARMHHHLSRLA